jgi:glycosyltransferase domain-containing protein
MPRNYTLVIPTYNRPLLLDSLLTHLEQAGADFPILVLDSSIPETQSKNLEACSQRRLQIDHVRFDNDIRPDQKLIHGIGRVKTDYCSLCADDDLVFPDAIQACLAHLENHADVALCHGLYLNFNPQRNHAELRIEYASSSIDGEDIWQRIFQILTAYEALNYAVFRTPALLDMVTQSKQVNSWMYWELFSNIQALTHGKAARLNTVYYARRGGMPQTAKHWEPNAWLLEDPDSLVSSFAIYRDQVYNLLVKHGSAGDRATAMRRLALLHLLYFQSSLDVYTLQARLKREIFPAQTVEQEDNGQPSLPFPAPAAARLWMSPLMQALKRRIKGEDTIRLTSQGAEPYALIMERRVQRRIPQAIINSLGEYCRRIGVD